MSQRMVFIYASVAIVIAIAIFGVVRLRQQSVTNIATSNITNVSVNTNTVVTNTATSAPTNIPETPVTNTSPVVPALVVIPMEGFFERITKKPFAIYITPKTSPIQPEKFRGYHTGADAETTSAEKNTDIPIVAIADGTVVFAGHVNGYGGVVLIRHVVNNETITALYGHLRISSYTKTKNQTVTMGEKIAVLGTGYSSETDDERKHLHFGIIKGTTINYKGYVTTKGALSAWEDPESWLKGNGA